MNETYRTAALSHLASLIRETGVENVRKIVEAEDAKIVEREQKLELGERFRFFRKEDWYGYADAARFADGVRPVTGTLRVKDADGVEQETLVIIAAVEEEKTGHATLKALVEFTTYGKDEEATEDNERTYQGEFKSLAAALGALHLINSAPKTVEISAIVEVFGFTRIN